MNEDRSLVPAHPEDAELPSAEGEVDAARAAQEQAREAQERAQATLQGVPPEAAPAPEPDTGSPTEGRRVFVSPEYLNGKFLVKPGPEVDEKLADGRTIKVRPDDIVARFRGGILATDDEEIIAWAKSHPEICRDVDDPETAIWVSLVEIKLEKANQASQLPPELDIDKLLRGDPTQLTDRLGGTLMSAARAARGA